MCSPGLIRFSTYLMHSVYCMEGGILRTLYSMQSNTLYRWPAALRLFPSGKFCSLIYQ